MKKSFLFLPFLFLFIYFSISAQEIVHYGHDAEDKIPGTSVLRFKEGIELPVYIKFKQENEFPFENTESWLHEVLKTDYNSSFVITSVEPGLPGELHYRCVQTFSDIPVFDGTFVVHTMNGVVNSINGTFYRNMTQHPSPYINENAALQLAMRSTGASSFLWQSEAEEAALKEHTEDSTATYFPKGELFLLKTEETPQHLLVWRFDIYASDTLLRQWIFVDALNSEVVLKLDRIQNTDTPGVAVTKYSGTQNITADSFTGGFRLRESGRGNGIRTYNMQEGKNYSAAVDFTDADNYWNNFNAQLDEVATDAHWAAERYYDYLYNEFGRNSLNNAGFALLSYVHYDVKYANAFWDGQRMTYGDGNGTTWSPLTSVDIAGHEMTHGLTSMTANLVYQNEPGAINEAFSDIFGTALEFYAKPASANWLIGEDIGSAIRSMSNPKAYGLPDTYLGQYWYTGTGDNGGVHYNCGVMAHWFYLISAGGSGTNDNGHYYNISAIGINKAEKIAFRTLIVYLTNNSQYADARFYSIQATADLYGGCSPEVAVVTNAWYAVGVGAQYSANVTADFASDKAIFCQTPASVQFTNLTSNATTYKWDFGDGNTSTAKNPLHTYSVNGNFNVKLVGYGGACGNDSITKNAFITVGPQNPCSYIMPASGSSNLNTCIGILYDIGGTGNYPDNSTSVTTISPPGAAGISLNFVKFDIEAGSGSTCDYDYIEIYNGPNTSSPLVGRYCNTTGNPGIVNTGGSATIKFYSDAGLNLPGFEMHWNCTMPNAAPVTVFIASQLYTCTGIVSFTDLSSNGPQNWFWDFGDGNTSSLQNPTHVYTADGNYTVKLVVSNPFGSDSLTKISYINVDMLPAPLANNEMLCDSGSFSLNASGTGSIFWFDAPVGGNIIAAGNTFNTPVISNSVTYYAGTIDTVNNTEYGGKPDNSGTGLYYSQNYTHYNIFNCTEPVILKSVKVYSSTTGNRTIYLRNSSGNVITSKTANIPSGVSRVTLDFAVPVANNLQLAGQNTPNLYRNEGSTAYPYVIGGGVLTITGSSATSNPTAYYYYFYDWEVIVNDTCTSPRIPVTAHVVNINPQISSQGPLSLCPGDSVVLTAAHNSIALQYLWYPNGDTLQSISVDTAGVYYYSIIDSSGCSAVSDSLVITLNSLPPIADFSYVINGNNVEFINNSILAQTYLWDFGDSTGSNIAAPIHTYSIDSIYNVTLIAYNGCGSDTAVVQVNFSSTNVVNHDDFVFNLFPNPSGDIIYIEMLNSGKGHINIEIVNVLGEIVYSSKIENNNHSLLYPIDISSMAKGLYFIKAVRNGATHTRKLLSY